MRKVSSGNKQHSKLTAIITGTAVALGVTICLSAIAGIFIQNEYLEIQLATVISIIIQGISALVGSFITGIKSPDAKLVTCISAGASYFVVLIAAAFLFFGGITISAIISLGVCMLAAFIAFLQCTKEKKHHVSSPKRKRYR